MTFPSSSSWIGVGIGRGVGGAEIARALLYAHADLLRDDIEKLKKNCC